MMNVSYHVRPITYDIVHHCIILLFPNYPLPITSLNRFDPSLTQQGVGGGVFISYSTQNDTIINMAKSNHGFLAYLHRVSGYNADVKSTYLAIFV